MDTSIKATKDVNRRAGAAEHGKRKAGQQESHRKGQKPTPLSEEARKAMTQRTAEDLEKLVIHSLENFEGKPRGVAAPGGEVVGKWNRNFKAVIVLYSPAQNFLLTCENLSGKLLLDVQNPQLRIYAPSHDLRIRSVNIEADFNKAAPADTQKLFLESSYPADITPTALIGAFKAQNRTPEMSEDIAKSIVAFAQHQEAELSGIHTLTFGVKGPFIWDALPSIAKQNKALVSLFEMLNGGSCIMTVIRKKPGKNIHIDNFWQSRMNNCVTRGVYHFYNEELGTVQGALFDAYVNNPKTDIRNMPWLRVPVDEQEESKDAVQYRGPGAKRVVGSVRELEIIQGVAIVQDRTAERRSVEAWFSGAAPHLASILSNKGGWVEIDVELIRASSRQMPTVEAGTRFDVRLLEKTSDTEDGEVVEQSTTFWRGSVINAEATKNFVVGFKVKENEHLARFVPGTRVSVTLNMQLNTGPSEALLRLVTLVAKPPNKKDAVRKKLLHGLLLGQGNLDLEPGKVSVKEDYFSRMTTEQKTSWDAWAAAIELNDRQQAFFNNVFDTNDFFRMLEAPPGAGKTRTLGCAVYGLALLKMKVMASAPSNVATIQFLDAIVKAQELLKTIDAAFADEFKILLLPTTAVGKSQIAAMTDGDESQAHLMVEESRSVDKYSEFQLSTHVLELIQSRANLHVGDAEDVLKARMWLDTRKNILDGAQIDWKTKQNFVKYGHAQEKEVLKDPKLRIVVTTCGNAARLHDLGYRPWASFLDEAAYGKEVEAYGSFGLNSRIIAAGGDRNQLKPLVKYMFENDFGSQYGMSLFERLYTHHAIPLFRLKLQYRMHPDIAEFPGLSTYQYLVSAPNTQTVSPVYAFYNEWWNSDGAAMYRDNRRFPQWEKTRLRETNRRLCINPTSGKSAPVEGGTSLRNFANINATVDMVVSLLCHEPSIGIEDLPGDRIAILTAYKEDKIEMDRQLKMAILQVFPDFLNFPKVDTVDHAQGYENDIVFCVFTPANPYHGSLLGFYRQWNRILVQITRAKDVCIFVANVEQWRSELKVIVKGFKCKRLGLLIVDLLDYGDIIDLPGNNRLPADANERASTSPGLWSRQIETMSPADSTLPRALSVHNKGYNEDAAWDYELQLGNELFGLRKTAYKLIEQSEKGVDGDYPVDFNLDNPDQAAASDEEVIVPDEQVNPEVPATAVESGPGKTESPLATADQTEQQVGTDVNMTGDTEQGPLGTTETDFSMAPLRTTETDFSMAPLRTTETDFNMAGDDATSEISLDLGLPDPNQELFFNSSTSQDPAPKVPNLAEHEEEKARKLEEIAERKAKEKEKGKGKGKKGKKMPLGEFMGYKDPDAAKDKDGDVAMN